FRVVQLGRCRKRRTVGTMAYGAISLSMPCVVPLPSSGPPLRSGSVVVGWWSHLRSATRTSDDDDLGADLCEVPGELGVELCLALAPAREPGAKLGFGLVRRV